MACRNSRRRQTRWHRWRGRIGNLIMEAIFAAAVAINRVPVVAFFPAAGLDNAIAANLQLARRGTAVTRNRVMVIALFAGFRDTVAANGRTV